MTIFIVFKYLQIVADMKAGRDIHIRKVREKKTISIDVIVTPTNFNKEIMRPIFQSSTEFQFGRSNYQRGNIYFVVFNLS